MTSNDSELKYQKRQSLISYGFIVASIITLIAGYYFSEKNISALGLVFDMSGFLLVFGFGLPSRFATNFDENTDSAKIVSWIGVVLVLAGFLCQFMGYVKH